MSAGARLLLEAGGDLDLTSSNGKMLLTGAFLSSGSYLEAKDSRSALAEQTELQAKNQEGRKALYEIIKFLDMNKFKVIDLFQRIDSDGSNDLDQNELQSALEKMGFHLEDDVAAQVIDALDVDGDGDVTTTEFFDRMKCALVTLSA